jgi:hypothetical protein
MDDDSDSPTFTCLQCSRSHLLSVPAASVIPFGYRSKRMEDRYRHFPFAGAHCYVVWLHQAFTPVFIFIPGGGVAASVPRSQFVKRFCRK